MHTKTVRALSRYRRPSAITLTAVCVLAGGGVATAAPASAADSAALVPVSASVITGPLPWQPGSEPLVWTQPVHRAPIRRPVVTHLTAAAVSANHLTVHTGASVVLTGTVTYGAAIRVRAQLVKLQAKHGSSWDTVDTQALSGTGYATFTVKPAAEQTYRIAYSGTRGLAPATSPAVTVGIAAPVATTTGYSSVSRSSAPSKLAFSAVTGGTGTGARVVALAAAQSGKPYVFAAAGPNSFDCSGLTEYVFAQVGISLPHKADAQKSYGVGVSAAAALPGDLVVFLSGGTGYHVGIYAGNGMMYDAPHTGTTVGLHSVYSTDVIFRRLV